MHTPRIPEIKKSSLSWLKPVFTIAVFLVSLLHAWEVIEDSVRSVRNRKL